MYFSIFIKYFAVYIDFLCLIDTLSKNKKQKPMKNILVVKVFENNLVKASTLVKLVLICSSHDEKSIIDSIELQKNNPAILMNFINQCVTKEDLVKIKDKLDRLKECITNCYKIEASFPGFSDPPEKHVLIIVFNTAESRLMKNLCLN